MPRCSASPRSLIESEPYRESGYVLLMDAYAAAGNVAEGLRVFERLRTLLREELGTIALARCDRRARAAAAARAGPAAAGRVRTLTSAGLRSGCRPSCSTEVRCRWSVAGASSMSWRASGTVAAGPNPVARYDAARRTGRVVLLTGDPGIGKTQAGRRDRAQSPRGGRVRARRPLAAGGARAVPAVRRGAPSLRV